MFRFVRAAAAATFALFAFSTLALAQTAAIEGDVKGEDGKGLQGALVKIERTDIKGNYKVKTDKKGHYFHAGLPLGQYNIVLEVNGKDVDRVQGVRTRLGDPTPVNFDMQANARKQAALQKAAESGQLTQEQARDMSPEQKAALEKQMKERTAAMAKNKALNDAFNGGMEALKTGNFDAAVEQFGKASEMDAKQHVIWGQLADAYMGQSKTKTGADLDGVLAKAYDAFNKALELKPEDAAYRNNFALALVRGKKFQEAEAELGKAAQLDPTNAGRYFYNLGAVLVNIGQTDPAGAAFKKAIEADPNYADAQYQYGIFLTGKAVTKADGSLEFPAGTKEAFQKYVELKPDGPFADSAKGMLATMDTKVQTEFTNPNAVQQQKKGAKKK
ncbi:MAG: hypothetical protein FJW40_19975 [Acidobacteria bacterium]|nr:hypothetical protein [Acidobacteriota bacterium]